MSDRFLAVSLALCLALPLCLSLDEDLFGSGSEPRQYALHEPLSPEADQGGRVIVFEVPNQPKVLVTSPQLENVFTPIMNSGDPSTGAWENTILLPSDGEESENPGITAR